MKLDFAAMGISLKTFSINGRMIGSGQSPYMIAELSANHNGSLENALNILEMSKRAGVDAVKLQTYTADTITLDHDGPGFVIEGGLWDGRTLHNLYEEAHLPWEWHAPLFARAKEIELTVFSSPFDVTAIDFLEELDCPAYKIASFELIDLPLIRRASATGKPVIMSSGMASEEEIGEAIAAAREAGDGGVAMLHCVSGYPAPACEANLHTISYIADKFDVISGLSDHTKGIGVSVAAIATGASIIEKHVTMSRASGGPDAAFSLEPDELMDLVSNCRSAFDALGKPTFARQVSEQQNYVFRRSLYVVADASKGDLVTPQNVRSIRPGLGIAPKYLDMVLGKTFATDVKLGTPLKWDLLV